jgi:hypothetical protein
MAAKPSRTILQLAALQANSDAAGSYLPGGESWQSAVAGGTWDVN